jgi:hypothetical protein
MSADEIRDFLVRQFQASKQLVVSDEKPLSEQLQEEVTERRMGKQTLEFYSLAILAAREDERCPTSDNVTE